MKLFSLIESAVLWAITSIINLLIAIVSPIVEPIFGNIPSFNFDFSFINSGFFGLLDMFFPVQYCLTLLCAYLLLASIVYSVNWILGFIPTVS